MKTIWKYEIPVTDEFAIEMPFESKILFVGTQQERGYIWAKVETINSTEARKFRIIGTGHPIDEHSLKYIGTYQLGQFVWHIFEELQNETMD